MRTPSLPCGSPATSSQVLARPSPERGFTVTDVLVGAAIVVVALAVAVFLFQTSARANANARAAAALRAASQNVIAGIEKDCNSSIACATPATDVGNHGNADGHEVAFYSRDAHGTGRFWSYCYRAPGSGTCAGPVRDGEISLYGPYRWGDLASGAVAAAYRGRIATNVALRSRMLTTAQLVDAARNPLTGPLWSTVTAAPPDVVRATGFPGFVAGNRILEVTLKAGPAQRTIHVLAGAHSTYRPAEVVGSATPTPNPLATATGAPGTPSGTLSFFAPVADALTAGITEANYGTRTVVPAQVYSYNPSGSDCGSLVSFVPNYPNGTTTGVNDGTMYPAGDGTGLATASVLPALQTLASPMTCHVFYNDNVGQSQSVALTVGATSPIDPVAVAGVPYAVGSTFTFTVDEAHYAGPPRGGFTGTAGGDCNNLTTSAGWIAGSTYYQTFGLRSTGPNPCTFTARDSYGQVSATASTPGRGAMNVTHWYDTPGQTASSDLNDSYSADTADHWWTADESNYSGTIQMKAENGPQCANFAFGSATSGGAYTAGNAGFPSYMTVPIGSGFAIHPVDNSLYMPIPCYVDIFDDVEAANYDGTNGATLAQHDPNHAVQFAIRTNAPPPTPVPTATPAPGGIVLKHYYGTPSDPQAPDLSDDFTHKAGYDHWWVGSEANYSGNFYTYHDQSCDNLAVATQSTTGYVNVVNGSASNNLGPQSATAPFWAMHYIDTASTATCTFYVFDELGLADYYVYFNYSVAAQHDPAHVVAFTVDKPAKSILYVDHWYDVPNSTIAPNGNDVWSNDTYDHWWTPRQTFYFGRYYLHFGGPSCDQYAFSDNNYNSPPYFTSGDFEYLTNPSHINPGSSIAAGGGYAIHPLGSASNPPPLCTMYVYTDDYFNNANNYTGLDGAAAANTAGDVNAGVVRVDLGATPAPISTTPPPALGPLTVTPKSFTWDPNSGANWAAGQGVSITKSGPYTGWIHVTAAATQNPSTVPNNCYQFSFSGFGGGNAIQSQINEPYANGASGGNNGVFSAYANRSPEPGASCTVQIASDDPSDSPVYVQLTTKQTLVPTPPPVPPRHTQKCVDATRGGATVDDWQYFLAPDTSSPVNAVGIPVYSDPRFTASIVGDPSHGMQCTAIFGQTSTNGGATAPVGRYSDIYNAITNYNGACGFQDGGSYYHSPGGGGCDKYNGRQGAPKFFLGFDIAQYSSPLDRQYMYNNLEDIISLNSTGGFCLQENPSRAEDSFVWAIDYTYQGHVLDLYGMPGYVYYCTSRGTWNSNSATNWPVDP